MDQTSQAGLFELPGNLIAHFEELEVSIGMDIAFTKDNRST
jgi:hypothetical protein